MSLQELLSRALKPSPNRGFRGVGGGAAYFGTDLGLRRDENQDRVAIAKWRASTGVDRGPLCAIVVSDGMGGMQDGAICAAETVSNFVSAIITSNPYDLQKAVTEAVNLANSKVFDAYRGRGGATLSAVVMDAHGAVVGVNVGDSRIYSPSTMTSPKTIKRLTVDDTLRDAYGSDNKDLLQFIGLGKGLVPHVFPIDIEDNILAITTDGAHFFDEKIFAEILFRSPDPKSMAERIIALSRWLGAPDNATIATVDLGRLSKHLKEEGSTSAELWIGGGDGPIYVIQQERSETLAADPVKIAEGQSTPPLTPSATETTKRKKRTAPKKAPLPEQLTIDVEVSKGGEPNADS